MQSSNPATPHAPHRKNQEMAELEGAGCPTHLDITRSSGVLEGKENCDIGGGACSVRMSRYPTPIVSANRHQPTSNRDCLSLQFYRMKQGRAT